MQTKSNNGSAGNTPLLALQVDKEKRTKEALLQCLIIMVIQITL